MNNPKAIVPVRRMIKTLRPKIPEIMKLKIGRKSEETRESRSGSTYRVPQKIDHFLVCRTTHEDDDDDANFEIHHPAMEALKEFQDDDHCVRQIPIRFGGELDEVLSSEYAKYDGRTKTCYGDGASARRRLPIIQNGKPVGWSSEEKTVSCPCEYLAQRKCKPNGRLMMKLDLPEVAVSGGSMVFRTTSIISIERLLGSLEEITHDVGSLVGYRMWAVLNQVKVAPEGRPMTAYVVHVELRSADVRALQHFVMQGLEIRKAVAAAVDYKALVASTSEEDVVAQADVAREFYPDAIETDVITETGKSPKNESPSPAKDPPLQDQVPTRHQLDAMKRKMATLSGYLYQPTTDKEERDRRKSAIFERINTGLGYKFTKMNMSQYVELMEVLERHILLEDGFVTLANLYDLPTDSPFETRAKIWAKVFPGKDLATQIDPSDLDSAIERIEFLVDEAERSKHDGKDEEPEEEEESDPDPEEEEEDVPQPRMRDGELAEEPTTMHESAGSSGEEDAS